MRLLKKKVNVFGKGIPVLAIFVLGIAVVSAALVGYLSGMVTGEVEVKSPMEVGISLGHDSWSTTYCLRSDTNEMVNSFPECDEPDIHLWDESDWTTGETALLLPVMYTGQEKTFTLYLMSANIAPGTEIKGYEEIIVTNPLGVTCGDFKSVVVRTDSINGDLGYGRENDALLICVQDGDRVKFDSTLVDDPDTEKIEGLSTWGAEETDVSEIVVTFNNVIGTYTFTYQVIPVEE